MTFARNLEKSHESNIERQGLPVVLDIAFRRPVEARRLEEYDRVRVANGRQQQPIGPLRRGRDDDTQPRNMGQHGLRALRMMLGARMPAPQGVRSTIGQVSRPWVRFRRREA